MSYPRVVLRLLMLVAVCGAPLAHADEIPLHNWTVPGHSASGPNLSANSDLGNPSTFVAVTPCRVVDTRNPIGAFGGPGFSANQTRTFQIPSGPCSGIPAVGSYSLNITIVNYDTAAGGFVTLYPNGTTRPFVSTVNFGQGSPIANAAVVPADGNGTIAVYSSGATHVIIDINGYFYGSGLMTAGEQFWLHGLYDGGSLLHAHNWSSHQYSYGVSGHISSTGATGGAGVRGTSMNGGQNYGVLGINYSPSTSGSYGVFGYAGNSVDQTQFSSSGVRGESYAYNGVVGVTAAVSSCAVCGGHWSSTAGGTLTEAGYLSWNGYAVYASGNLAASGTKNFVEPHPTDATKVIRFAALEGPEAATYFRGRGHFANGHATIEVPESFRLVTQEEGLTVNVTPMGHIASVGVISADLQRIEVESTRDVDFSFIVYGVRHGYGDYTPIGDGPEFVPQSASARMPAYLNEAEKQALISNGTYNADGSVNLATAERMGWAAEWRRTEAAAAAHKSAVPED